MSLADDVRAAQAAKSGFADFDPIDTAAPVMPLPIECLSTWQRDMVHDVAQSTGFSQDMAVGFCLAATAAAIGGKIRVSPTGDGWEEPCNLYVAIVNDASEGKSVVFKPMTKALFDLDAQIAESDEGEVAGKVQLRQVAEMRLKSAKESLLKSKVEDRASLEAEVRELAAELAKPEPVVRRLVVGDVTPEVCALRLAEQNERIAVLTAEDTLFGHLGGRHTSNAKATPAVEVFLSAYTGEPVTVDRLSRKTIKLRAPALTIGAAMQPAVLTGNGTKLAEERGLLARFLYIKPKRVVGYRDLSREPPPANGTVRRTYDTRLRALAETGLSLSQPHVLRLDYEARQTWREWRCSFEPRRSDAGDLATIRTWAGKAEGHVLRIAGLLAVSVEKTVVTTDILGRAITIVEALVSHTKAAVGLSQVDDDTRRAVQLLEWIRRHRDSECSTGDSECSWTFTEADARRMNKSWLKSAPMAAAACRILHEHGYLRRSEKSSGTKPAARWEPHPTRVSECIGVQSEKGDREVLSLPFTGPLSTWADTPKHSDSQKENRDAAAE